ncbi:glutamate receptor ionotropic, delta-2-like isoform X2 [Scylla paramamosain]
MGEAWHCLLVVVVSDDPAFLAAFGHLSLRRHALRWSTRVLVLTRLPLTHLGGLHGLLSNRNAMLLLVHRGQKKRDVGVYVAMPFSPITKLPNRVASWSASKTWTQTLQSQFFPDKFFVFASAPTLTVAVELMPHHSLTWVDDPLAKEGRRLVYTGALDKSVTYLAKAMNFTHRYVLSPDRTFGTIMPDGSWTGMMGMVVREEVDFGGVPFMLSPARAAAGDYTAAIGTGKVIILGGLGGLKIDPWGFLLPLTPIVWASALTALLSVLALLEILSLSLSSETLHRGAFSPVRILLQQGETSWTVLGPACLGLPCILTISVLSGSSSRALMKTNSASLTPNADVVWPAEWWWWERLVLGLWMLTTLVLTRSYAGNLMSLLAVRYVPQPFQTLRDVLDHPSVAMIWQKYSKNEEFLRGVQSGMFREVADMEKKGRLKFHTQTQFSKSLDTLVRAGDHVLVEIYSTVKTLMALDFSKKGRCDFYLSRDGFLPFSSSIISQKTNPIIQGLSPRVMALTESGILTYWVQDVANFTRCNNVPKKVAFSTTLSFTNLWGVFALLAGGLTAGLVVWCLELLNLPAKKSSWKTV